MMASTRFIDPEAETVETDTTAVVVAAEETDIEAVADSAAMVVDAVEATLVEHPVAVALMSPKAILI